jgi:aspartate/methionine/tyrosine aminotransferase
VRLNPVLEGLGTYPFVRLDQAKRAAVARGIELIDFGIGEPREETPAFIRAALAEALDPVTT